MTNLKDKILHALHNNKRLGTILDEVSNSQENLLKIILIRSLTTRIKTKFYESIQIYKPLENLYIVIIHFMKTIWLK